MPALAPIALLLFMAAALCVLPARAAGPTLALDGIADEDFWRDAQVFDDFHVTDPYTLATPTHATVARLAALPEGLAVSFVCEQPTATPRVRPRAGRDTQGNADRINFAVDFDGDGRLAYNFMVTLGNAIGDEVISNESRYNPDWDGVWQHAVHDDGERWSVELLIPWSVAAMRGEESSERRIAVYFDRVIAARGERSATPSASFTRPRFVSEFTPILVASHRAKSLFSVVPYASAQHDLVGNASHTRAGVDLYWKPSSHFQLNAAIHPDFGQVEADDLVVNFDAIEVFFSDKRPFFTENQGIFEVETPGNGRLLYTRRIGAGRDDGQGTSDIDAALKLTGSAGGFDYGTLAALESDHADDLGRAFLVQRLVRGIGRLTLGYTGTWVDRPFLDRRAQVHGIDAVWRPDPRWLVSGQVLASAIDSAGIERDGRGAWLRASYSPGARWQHALELTHFDRNLDFNDAGYQRRGDYNELEWNTTLLLGDFPQQDWRRSVTWEIEPQLRYNDRGDRLPPELEIASTVALRNGGIWNTELAHTWRGFDDLISRGNGLVLQESRFKGAYSAYESPRLRRWQFLAGLWVGQEGNHGHAAQPELALRYFPRDNLDLHLQFVPTWSQDWLIWRQDSLFASYRSRRQSLNFDLNWFPGARHELRLKTQWLGIEAHSPQPYRIGEGGRLVESRDEVDAFTSNSFGVQLRYRYEFAAQRELYLVYARGGDEQMRYDALSVRDRDGLGGLFGDILDLRDAEQVLMKLRWAF